MEAPALALAVAVARARLAVMEGQRLAALVAMENRAISQALQHITPVAVAVVLRLEGRQLAAGKAAVGLVVCKGFPAVPQLPGPPTVAAAVAARASAGLVAQAAGLEL